MRNKFRFLGPVLDYLGALYWVLGVLLLAPVALAIFYAKTTGKAEVSPLCFMVPAGASFVLAFALRWGKRGRRQPLTDRGAMLVCGLGWICLSAVGALPFWMAGLKISYLDAYFETVSGFTTTGITMLQGLDDFPLSIIFWRAFTQWLGGLGILTFFLAVSEAGGSAHRLFSAESHKIFSRRPTPGLFRTLRILWMIYAGFTALIVGLLVLAGMSVFDAVTHSFACLSTGGYSPYDASIAHYREAGFPHFVAIEYILTLGMVLGGMNFFIHFRVLTGSVRALWDNLEVRLWWIILGGATALLVLDRWMSFGSGDMHGTVRNSLFQVVSIATTTGFATVDINTEYFPSLSKQLFLILMVIGGCVGSTGGGIKVLRIAVLLKMVGRQLRRVIHGRRAVNPVLVDGESIPPEEIRRICALFFAWIALLAFGGAMTALFSRELDAMQSASGMFSALGNIGPCYISVAQMTQLDPVVKLTYIAGMLAGRLEILPILMLFSRRTWK